MTQSNMQNMKRFIRPVTFGVMFGAISCILTLFVMATIMGLRDIPQSIVSLVATLSFVVGGFVAGYASSVFAREKGMALGLLCGLCLFCILSIASLAFDGSGFGMQAVTKLVAVITAAAIGGVLGVNKKKKFRR